ncbi:MAG: hypothetical protein DMF53_14340, partial [Acidobacteria bacterium]
SVTLENLSLGGVGLSGVPENWQTGQTVHFRLGLAGEPEILDVRGTVTWREGDTIGIAFSTDAAGEALLIQKALRRFLDARR